MHTRRFCDEQLAEFPTFEIYQLAVPNIGYQLIAYMYFKNVRWVYCRCILDNNCWLSCTYRKWTPIVLLLLNFGRALCKLVLLREMRADDDNLDDVMEYEHDVAVPATDDDHEQEDPDAIPIVPNHHWSWGGTPEKPTWKFTEHYGQVWGNHRVARGSQPPLSLGR